MVPGALVVVGVVPGLVVTGFVVVGSKYREAACVVSMFSGC